MSTLERLLRRDDLNLQKALRANSGALGDGLAARDLLISGDYNPVYYSGDPSVGGNYATNRAGFYGLDTITTEREGTNFTYSTNGAAISNTYHWGRASIACSNPVFTNCVFRGYPKDFTTPLTCGSSSVNPTFIDCTFWPLAPQYKTPTARVGLGGGTFIRCDFYGGSDGLSNNSTSGWPQQWNFIQCAFHNMVYFSPDPDAAGGLPDNASHTDLIQWSGGRLRIEGCGLWGFYDMRQYAAPRPNVSFGTGNPPPYHVTGNKYTDTSANAGDARTPPAVIGQPSIYTTSCVMISPALTNISYFEINNSFMDGTTYAVNVNGEYDTTFGGFAGPFKFTNNKVGKNHRGSAYGTNKAIIARSALHASMTISGNTDLATGAALSSAALLQNG